MIRSFIEASLSRKHSPALPGDVPVTVACTLPRRQNIRRTRAAGLEQSTSHDDCLPSGIRTYLRYAEAGRRLAEAAEDEKLIGRARQQVEIVLKGFCQRTGVPFEIRWGE